MEVAARAWPGGSGKHGSGRLQKAEDGGSAEEGPRSRDKGEAHLEWEARGMNGKVLQRQTVFVISGSTSY